MNKKTDIFGQTVKRFAMCSEFAYCMLMLAVCFCYSCGLAFIVVRFYTADDLARNSIDTVTISG